MRVMVVFTTDPNDFWHTDYFITECENRDSLTDEILTRMLTIFLADRQKAEWIVKQKCYFLANLREDDFEVTGSKVASLL